MTQNLSRKEVLDKVYTEVIAINDDVLKKSRSLVHRFVAYMLLREMRECDDLFNSWYQEVFFAGSFYDGLYLDDKTTKFDLYFVLQLPLSSETLKLCDKTDYINVPPGKAVLRLDKSMFEEMSRIVPPDVNSKRLIDLFTNAEGFSGDLFFLSPEKFSEWFGGVVQKAIDQIVLSNTSWISRKISREIYFPSGMEEEKIHVRIVKSTSGHDLVIKTESGMSVTVALIPALCFGEILAIHAISSDELILWQLSHAKRERQIIYGQSCSRKVMKLLKKFQDMQGLSWAYLDNYHIKTIVMLEQKDIWRDRNVGDVFLGVLNYLYGCLINDQIPCYFDKELNLIANWDVSQTSAMKERLGKILKDINENPPITIKKYFVKQICCTETIDGESPSSCMVM